MPLQFVLPSKKRLDVVSVLADFSTLIPSTETITVGELDISVFTGVDPAPNDLKDGTIFILDLTLRHRIKLGVPGVIYQLVFRATTDAGTVYEVQCRQAVIIDETPVGPVYQQFYFTSRPYPLESIDGLASGFMPVQGYWIQIPLDGILDAFTPVEGTLRDLVLSYTILPEGIESSGFEPLEGTLRNIVLSYTILPEGITSAFDPLSGTLVNIVITYSNYPPEGILSSFTPLGGTLV